MFKVIFESEIYDVLDITNDCYICAPVNRNEGYCYLTKSKCIVI